MARTTSRRSLLAGLAVGAVGGAAGCLADGRDVDESVTETVPADGLDGVAVSTALGDIDVRANERNVVDVDGTKAAVSQDDLESIALETAVDDDLLRLAVDRDDSRSVFGLRPAPVLDLTLAVPASLALRRIETAAGRIAVSDAGGPLTAATDSGDIALRDVTGPVSVVTGAGAVTVRDPESLERIETDTGDVAVSLPAIDRDATIETSAGAVELRLPDELDLTLEITTETGDIVVRGVDDLPEMAGDSLIEAVVGTGRHRLAVSTETGDVTVTGRE